MKHPITVRSKAGDLFLLRGAQAPALIISAADLAKATSGTTDLPVTAISDQLSLILLHTMHEAGASFAVMEDKPPSALPSQPCLSFALHSGTKIALIPQTRINECDVSWLLSRGYSLLTTSTN